jgi:hypothetical protein
MSTVHKTEYSKIYLIPPHGSLSRWIHWGGTDGDIAPYRDIFPHWVSGGAPGDPNPVLIVDWKESASPREDTRSSRSASTASRRAPSASGSS